MNSLNSFEDHNLSAEEQSDFNQMAQMMDLYENLYTTYVLDLWWWWWYDFKVI